MSRIIEELDCRLYVEVTKTSRKARFDAIELCLDRVEELGDFVEAEMLVPEDADYAQVTEELWGVFERFGIDRTMEVTDGYDTLMS
jgi:predicted adenylyl cyclase CyaB